MSRHGIVSTHRRSVTLPMPILSMLPLGSASDRDGGRGKNRPPGGPMSLVRVVAAPLFRGLRGAAHGLHRAAGRHRRPGGAIWRWQREGVADRGRPPARVARLGPGMTPEPRTPSRHRRRHSFPICSRSRRRGSSSAKGIAASSTATSSCRCQATRGSSSPIRSRSSPTRISSLRAATSSLRTRKAVSPPNAPSST